MKFYENLEDAMKHLTTRGAFLTVKDDTGVNTMTIAWDLFFPPIYFCGFLIMYLYKLNI